MSIPLYVTVSDLTGELSCPSGGGRVNKTENSCGVPASSTTIETDILYLTAFTTAKTLPPLHRLDLLNLRR